jgi:hypothetical protein
VELDRDDTDESSCDEERVPRVGASVVEWLPLTAIARSPPTQERREEKK